jgi:hypothetical protein
LPAVVAAQVAQEIMGHQPQAALAAQVKAQQLKMVPVFCTLAAGVAVKRVAQRGVADQAVVVMQIQMQLAAMVATDLAAAAAAVHLQERRGWGEAEAVPAS